MAEWLQLVLNDTSVRLRKRPEGGIETEGYDFVAERLAHTLTGSPVALLEYLWTLDQVVRAHPDADLAELIASSQISTAAPREVRFSTDPLLLTRAAFGRSDYRHRAAGNPNTPVHLLQMLSHDSLDSRRWLARNEAITLEIGLRLARDKDSTLRARLARNPACPLEVLEILLQDSSPMVASRAAGHPAISEKRLRQLATGPEHLSLVARTRLGEIDVESLEEVRDLERIARVETAPPDLLLKLAQHPEDRVRAVLASHPCPPHAAFALLVKDSSPRVRRQLALNPSTPAEILLELVSDPRLEVRVAVARLGNLPPQAARLLAADADATVRREVARNGAAPEDVTALLSQDKVPAVAGAARRQEESRLRRKAAREEVLRSLKADRQSASLGL